MERVECPRKYQRGRIFREMLSIAGFSRRQNDRRVDFPFGQFANDFRSRTDEPGFGMLNPRRLD